MKGYMIPFPAGIPPAKPKAYCTYCEREATITTWTRDDQRSTRSRQPPARQLVCADCFAALTGTID